MNPAFHSLLGLKFVGSSLLVDQNHVGTWLNGYRASPNRSARVQKKLLFGSRKRRRIVAPMIETVPKREIYQLPTGEIVGHPETLAELTRQSEEWGAILGMPRST